MPLDTTKIRKLRLQLGLSMDEAGKAAGMHGKGSWYNVESGRTPNLTIAKLERIAAVLGTTAKDLLQ